MTEDRVCANDTPLPKALFALEMVADQIKAILDAMWQLEHGDPHQVDTIQLIQIAQAKTDHLVNSLEMLGRRT